MRIEVRESISAYKRSVVVESDTIPANKLVEIAIRAMDRLVQEEVTINYLVPMPEGK